MASDLIYCLSSMVISLWSKGMVRKMVYGYARVSTAKQAVKGNSLEDQEHQLREAGALEIVSEYYTGTKMERPKLTALLEQLQEGDKLIVTKLDRFARTAVEGGNIIRKLLERGVSIHILNMGLIDNSPTGRLITTILLAFAEFERDLIVERTQTGKAIARSNGIRVDGRPPKYTDAQVNHAMDLLQEHSYTEVERMTGISRSTLVRKKRMKPE